MGWLIAWLGLAVFIGIGCAATVGHPILYGFFVSTVVVGLLWALNAFFGGIIDAIFGRKK